MATTFKDYLEKLEAELIEIINGDEATEQEYSDAMAELASVQCALMEVTATDSRACSVPSCEATADDRPLRPWVKRRKA